MLRHLLWAVALAMLLAGCASAGEDDDMMPDIPEDPVSPAASEPSDSVVEVQAGTPTAEMRFAPEALSARAGEVLEVRVTNAGQAPHTWTLRGVAADSGMLQPGESAVVKLRVPEGGPHEVYCALPGHYEDGMRGTLIVA